MLNKRRNIFLLLVLISVICVILIIYLINITNPIKQAERKLNLKLPDTAVVEKFQGGQGFDAKILIPNQSVDEIKDQLNVFFHGTAKINKTDIPHFINTCPWWDMDTKNVEKIYMKFITGGKGWLANEPKSREIWAFISKTENGQYYLYISY